MLNQAVANPAIQDIADEVIRFRRDGVRPARPLPCHPIGSEDDAEQIQEIAAAAIGRAVVGWKLGATDDAGRKRLKLTRPFIGRVFQNRLYHHPAILDPVFLPHCIPEAEIAVRIDHDLPISTRPYSVEDIIAAASSFHAAFEIVDFTWTDRTALSGIDYLADNGGCGGMVVGPAYPISDQIGTSIELEIDGKAVAANTVDKSLLDLLAPVAWLANHLLERGECLKAGQYVATGNWTGMTELRSRQRAFASFEKLGWIQADMP